MGTGVEKESAYFPLNITVNLKLLKKVSLKSFVPTELLLFDLSARSLEKSVKGPVFIRPDSRDHSVRTKELVEKIQLHLLTTEMVIPIGQNRWLAKNLTKKTRGIRSL